MYAMQAGSHLQHHRALSGAAGWVSALISLNTMASSASAQLARRQLPYVGLRDSRSRPAAATRRMHSRGTALQCRAGLLQSVLHSCDNFLQARSLLHCIGIRCLVPALPLSPYATRLQSFYVLIELQKQACSAHAGSCNLSSRRLTHLTACRNMMS